MLLAGTDINAVHRSNNGALLVTGDDDSKVKLFRNPSAASEGSTLFNEGLGHSSHVTNARFNVTDKLVLTTGGRDRCVMQWRVA